MVKNLQAALVISLFLIPITYYLAPDTRVSFFPTYIVGILGLALLVLHRPLLKPVADSGLILTFLFTTFLASTWMDTKSIPATLLYLGYSLLILTYIGGIFIAAIKFDWFLATFSAVIIAAATVSAIFSMYFFYFLDYQPLPESRLFALGGLSNPVISAISYGCALVLCLSYVFRTSEKGLRITAIVACSVLALAIVLTGTRSSLIGLLTSTACLILINPWKNANKKGMAIVIFLVCIILVALLAIVSGQLEELTKRSFSFRPEIWRETLSLWWQSNIWLGVGLDKLPKLTIGPNTFLHPHSLYISTLYYGGLLGMSALAFLIARCLWILNRKCILEVKITTYPLFVFGFTTLLFDGDRAIEKINFLWFAFWLPVAYVLVGEAKFKRQQTQAH